MPFQGAGKDTHASGGCQTVASAAVGGCFAPTSGSPNPARPLVCPDGLRRVQARRACPRADYWRSRARGSSLDYLGRLLGREKTRGRRLPPDQATDTFCP